VGLLADTSSFLEEASMLGLLIVLVVIVLLFGGVGYVGPRYGYGGSMSLITVLVVIILLVVVLRILGVY
jgi:hypothetical protein